MEQGTFGTYYHKNAFLVRFVRKLSFAKIEVNDISYSTMFAVNDMANELKFNLDFIEGFITDPGVIYLDEYDRITIVDTEL